MRNKPRKESTRKIRGKLKGQKKPQCFFFASTPGLVYPVSATGHILYFNIIMHTHCKKKNKKLILSQS